MEAKSPLRVAALLVLLAVVGWPGVHSQLRAQDAILRAPEGPQLGVPAESFESIELNDEVQPTEEPEPDPQLFSPTPQVLPPRPVTQPGAYWIVSSRHCRNPHGRAPNCGLHYYYVTPDRKIHISNEQLFVGSLPPGSPVCVVVHGSFHSWESIVMGSSAVYKWLASGAGGEQPTTVFYTWPSDKPNTMVLPLDFAILGRRSEYHGAYLAKFISAIPPEHPVGLIAHSHGARTVSAALQLRAGGAVDGYRPGRAADFDRRIRVVFAAAAIDNTWLNPGERFGQALSGTEYLVNLRNRDDAALALYPLRRIFSGDALAKTGFTPQIRRSLGQWSSRLTEIDVTTKIGTGHFFHNYLEHPEIARSITPTLFYADAQPAITPEAAPAQAGSQAEQMTFVVPQRRKHSSPVRPAFRETYSNIGRVRPLGRQ